MIRKNRYTFTPVCDGCDKELEPERDYQLAVAAMKRDGWAIVRPNRMCAEWYNFCPKCKERVKKDG